MLAPAPQQTVESDSITAVGLAARTRLALVVVVARSALGLELVQIRRGLADGGYPRLLGVRGRFDESGAALVAFRSEPRWNRLGKPVL